MEARDGLRTDIGKGLQWLRKSLGLTQYQLAALAQLDYRHYQNIETGRVEVKVETLNRICEAFGIKLCAFFAVTDRKPWLIDKPTRNRGGGELYVFRIAYEHGSFRMFEEVRHILSNWGHDLSQGHRENLERISYPCFETDRSGRCLWKNAAAAQLRIAPAGGSLKELFFNGSDFENFLSALEPMFGQEAHSLYREFNLRVAAGEDVKTAAVLGLKPLSAKETASVFVASVDISPHSVPHPKLLESMS